MGKYQYVTQEEKELCEHFTDQLAEYNQKGIMITLSGEQQPIDDIVTECVVRERGKNTGDYITDSAGKVVELRFDKITQKK